VKDSAAQQAKPSLSDLAVWDEGPATSKYLLLALMVTSDEPVPTVVTAR
jgi:hypothetical protein